MMLKYYVYSLSQVNKYSFVKGLQMACQVSFADEGFVTAHPQEASETDICKLTVSHDALLKNKRSPGMPEHLRTTHIKQYHLLEK
jgi:hypothetical protein